MILFTNPARTVDGQIFDVRAYTVDSDGAYAHITDSAEWSSSNPATVSLRPVSGSSRSFAVNSAGTAIITARYGDATGYLPVRVPQQPVPSAASVTLRGESASVMLRGMGQRQQLSALFFANGRNTNVTSTAEWVSSNPSVATVDHGTITSQGVGTTEVTATYEGVPGSTFISVHPALTRQ